MNTDATAALARLCKAHGVQPLCARVLLLGLRLRRPRRGRRHPAGRDLPGCAAGALLRLQVRGRAGRAAHGRRPLLPGRSSARAPSTATRPGCATTSWSTPSSADALTRGQLTLHHGGEMWRPLVDVRDAAQAYVAPGRGGREPRSGARSSTCATRTCASRSSPCACGRPSAGSGSTVDLRPDYRPRRRAQLPGFGREDRARPEFPPEGVDRGGGRRVMEQRVGGPARTDFENPRYYNIRWLQRLEEAPESRRPPRLRPRLRRRPSVMRLRCASAVAWERGAHPPHRRRAGSSAPTSAAPCPPPRSSRCTRAELDVTDPDAVARALAAHTPAWVVNTAAFHRVDDIEATRQRAAGLRRQRRGGRRAGPGLRAPRRPAPPP